MSDLTVQKQIGESQAISEIKFMMSIAQQNPRDELAATQSLIRSMSRLPFAEASVYQYPRGGSIVKGPSVKLAREIARVWGSIRYSVTIIEDDRENRTIEGMAWDLQTNTAVKYQATFGKLVQKKIWEDKKHVRTDWVPADERELRELTNKQGSILIRNCILSLVPADIVDELVDKSIEIQKSMDGDPQKIRESLIKAVNGFVPMGIQKQNLEVFLGCVMSGWGSDELVKMRGLYSAIKDGLVGLEEFKEKTKSENGFGSMEDFLASCSKVEKKL